MKSVSIGISSAASWAWGTSLIVGMQIMRQKGFESWLIWAVANSLTLALLGFLYGRGLLGRQVFDSKPVKYAAILIQCFCLTIQMNIIYQVLGDILHLGHCIKYITASSIGIFFTLLMYKRGLITSILTDIGQFIITIFSILAILLIGAYTNVPNEPIPVSTDSDILWGIWSACILLSGPIGDIQHWQRVELENGVKGYYLGAMFFGIYMGLIGLMSMFQFNTAMNTILLIAVLCVTTSTIDSIAVALHEVSNKKIGTLVSVLICILWGVFVEIGVLTLWSYAGIYRVGFALCIIFLALYKAFLYKKQKHGDVHYGKI